MQWMGIHDIATFTLAVLVFLALPGPGTLTLLTATGQGGVRAGYAALAGLALGDQVLIWLAAAGVAALLVAHPLLFKTVQYAGAVYLVFIGWQLWRARGGSAPMAALRIESRRFFRQGLLVTLSNPKAIVFYMTFFPLFIDPATHRGLPTFAAMAAVIVLATLLYCSGLILLGHALGRRLQGNRTITGWLRKATGTFLVGFGFKLGLSA